MVLGAMLISSCKDDLVFTGSKDEKRIVAVITAEEGKQISVEIHESQLITEDTLAKPIQGAEVRLYQNSTLVETKQSPANGIFKTNFISDQLDSLRVVVQKDGYNRIEGTAQIPDHVNIIQFDTVARAGSDLLMKMAFIDRASIANFYLIDMRLKRWIYTLHPINGSRIDSTLVWEAVDIESPNKLFFSDQNIVTNSQKFELFNDKVFNGQYFVLDLQLNSFLLRETQAKGKAKEIEVELRNVNEEYYDFLTSLSLNRPIYGGPFAVSAQIPGNIHGGYGIFAAYTSTRATIVMP